MSLQDQQENERRLLSLLPGDGSPRTNAELRSQRDLAYDDYWRVCDALVEQGKVFRLRGRGGRTALLVETSEEGIGSSSQFIGWPALCVLILAGVLFSAAMVYPTLWGAPERWFWDSVALAFGAVSVSAVGIALIIFRVQTQMQRDEGTGQGKVFVRLHKLAVQTAKDSSDASNFLREMRHAREASSSGEAASGDSKIIVTDDTESVHESDRPADEIDVFKDESEKYYRPSAVPLKVIADLVNWWTAEGESGPWAVANLVGGYRAFNSAGHMRGVPWILTFKGSSGNLQTYRVSYSGKKAAGKSKAEPTVSAHTDGSGCHALVDVE